MSAMIGSFRRGGHKENPVRTLKSIFVGSCLVFFLIGLVTGILGYAKTASAANLAYIYNTDTTTAQDFATFLTTQGHTATLISMSNVGGTNLSGYDLIIIGSDTGSLGSWGDEASVNQVNNSGEAIIGLGEGGYAFFGKINLAIGWPWGWHGGADSIYVMDPSHQIFNSPTIIPIPSPPSPPDLLLYSEPTGEVGIYIPSAAPDLTLLGREVGDLNHYPLVQQGNRYILWGFAGSPVDMTTVGQDLFNNIIVYMITPVPIRSIIPNYGIMGNQSLSFTLNGTGFQPEATVQLTNFVLINPPNQTSIDATISTISPTQITGTFDLRGAAIGQYDVVVTNPNGQSAILPKGFTVLDTSPPVTTASPVGGTYNAPLIVSLSANEPATIYYTTNGNQPDTNSAVYSGSIPISDTTTLRFFAIDAAGNSEDPRNPQNTQAYTIDTRITMEVQAPDTPIGGQILVTSTFTFPVDTRTFVADCQNVTHTLRDSNGNPLPPHDWLKAYSIGPPDTPGSDVTIYHAGVPFQVTCDVAQMYPPELLVAGAYTLEATYHNYFQPQGINLFKGSISAPAVALTVVANPHIIEATAGPNGSISPSGSVFVIHGGRKTFDIQPDPGYHVLDVKVDGDCKGPIHTYTFKNVTGDHTIEATFAINTYIIIAATGFHGTISPFGIVMVKYGESKTFTIKPDRGYHVDKLLVDLKPVVPPPSNSYTFKNVTGYHVIFATFAK